MDESRDIIRSRSLVIGLGGTGGRVLVQLKRMFHERFGRHLSDGDGLALVNFDLDNDPQTTADGKYTLEPGIDFIHVEAENIWEKIKMLNDPNNVEHYREWYPDLDQDYIDYHAVAFAGAGQFRCLGRLGLFSNDRDIFSELQRRLREIEERETRDGEKTLIYVVSSLGGGTGSGMLLDMAYYVRKTAKDKPIVNGFLLLPDVYEDWDVDGRLWANSYATLKELSYFYRSKAEFKAAYQSGEVVHFKEKGEPPFDMIFLANNYLGKGVATSRSEVAATMMAGSIFSDVTSDLWSKQLSVFTNIGLHHAKREKPLDPGLLPSFAVSGAVNIHLPTLDTVRERIAERALARLSEKTDSYREDWDKKRESNAADLNIDPVVRFLKEDLRNTSNAILEMDDAGYKFLAERIYEIVKPDLNSTERLFSHFDQWWDHDPHTNSTLPSSDRFLPNEAPVLSNKHLELRQNIADKIKAIEEEAGGEELNLMDKSRIMDRCARVMKAHYNNYKDDLDNIVKKTVENKYRASFQPGLRELVEASPRGKAVRKLIFSHIFEKFLREIFHEVHRQKLKQLRILYMYIEILNNMRDKFESQAARKAELESGPAPAMAAEGPPKPPAYISGVSDAVNLHPHDDEKWAEAEDDLACEIAEAFWEESLRAGLDRRWRESGKVENSDKARGAIDVEALRERVREKVASPFRLLDPSILRRMALRAKNDQFITDKLVNPSRENVVFVNYPSLPEGGKGAEVDIERLVRSLRSAFHARRFCARSYELDENRGEATIFVKYISLNHPAANLEEVEYYASFYGALPGGKSIFHVHKDYEHFPDITITKAKGHVGCGNQGCEYDISSLPRNETVCPACERPIRTRCGNENCECDNVDEQLAGAARHVCPDCGGFLHTYWWNCPTHGGPISSNHEVCPRCKAEADKGNIGRGDIKTREGKKMHVTCPGCDAKGIPPHDAYKIPWEHLLCFVEDERQQEAEKIYYELEKESGKKGCCPVCGAFLIPFCPYSLREGDPHFLLEDCDGKLYCNDQSHWDRKIFVCFHCGMPLAEDQDTCHRCGASELGVLWCPRCNIEAPFTTRDGKCELCGTQLVRKEPGDARRRKGGSKWLRRVKKSPGLDCKYLRCNEMPPDESCAGRRRRGVCDDDAGPGEDGDKKGAGESGAESTSASEGKAKQTESPSREGPPPGGAQPAGPPAAPPPGGSKTTAPGGPGQKARENGRKDRAEEISDPGEDKDSGG